MLSVAVELEKRNILPVKINILAMRHVIMAISNNSLRSNFKAESSSMWTEGIPYEFVEKLKEEYILVNKTETIRKTTPRIRRKYCMN